MKKIQIIIVSFLMLGIGFLATSCEPDTHSLGSLPNESKLDFEVVQDLVAKPGGNLVKLKNLTPGVIPYWSYTDSNGNELGHTNLGETSIVFPFAGTYNISFIAFDKGGSVSSTKTITVTENDTSLFGDPRWDMLTNGVEGKTWILKMEAPIEFIGRPTDYVNIAVSGHGWWPNFSDIGWAGYENKDWGEITFDLNGGFNVSVTQTSVVAGSTAKTTKTGTFTFQMTDGSTNDRLIFNGGLEMLHMNGSYNTGFTFSNVKIVELTDDSLAYIAIREDTDNLIYHLIPKP